MPKIKCAIYTRESTEHGLDMEFNSLQNQENKESPPLVRRFVNQSSWAKHLLERGGHANKKGTPYGVP